jgi:SAM-dependent methyltransferase
MKDFIFKSYLSLKGIVNYFSNYKTYTKEFREIIKQESGTKKRFELSWKDRTPCLLEKTDTSPFDKHYVYHTAWAARKLAQTAPKKHVDISSHIYFNALVSAFIPIDFYDYRPAEIYISGLKSKQADLCDLPFKTNSIQSLSCMHVVEHIGLGRYGDPIDYDGDLKAISELKRVLRRKGNLFFVTPIRGTPRIQFNGQRQYSYELIKDLFSDLKLVEFSLIPDVNRGDKYEPIENASKNNSDCQVAACGCFWFKKI